MAATRLALAAFGGAAAAMAMTGMRQLTTELGIVDQVPPEAMIRQKAPRVVKALPERHRNVVIELFHWTYGAGGGVMFKLLPQRIRRQTWAGPVFGLGLWFVFEVVVVPVFGLRQAHESRPAERVAFFVDHLLYGLILSGNHWERED